jgi:PLP dependent protein
MNIRKNISTLKHQLPASVTLVAVSKKKSAELIMQAYDSGHRDFGENYVQEMLEKQGRLPVDIRWHFVGHLQSNKVKQIAPFVHLIHGVDSLKLLSEIGREGQKAGRVIDCLLQLHVASEETKFGLSFDECRTLLVSPELAEITHARVRGFMAMATNTTDEDQIRIEFRSVREFRDSLSGSHSGLDILSFGMSGDYQLAVSEGSNMLRIGSLIFGER